MLMLATWSRHIACVHATYTVLRLQQTLLYTCNKHYFMLATDNWLCLQQTLFYDCNKQNNEINKLSKQKGTDSDKISPKWM